jgi:hypothetical protein
VVETSLGVPTGSADCVELNPSGWRCMDLVIANTHKAREGALGGLVIVNTSGETSVFILQARESH